ncbi:MFS transporter [Smaragdicoccus niigatensis]|uniref:MFS transporter n=1 Tax=Smaragdicoccus niigatensis TaxID=359359 RepID=UPI000376DDB8|nr:MFS transporter [Smaragdicoccus niigatensis]
MATTATREKLPSEIWVLVASSFVIALGYGLIAPVLPEFAHSFGVSLTAASAVISAFAGMRLLFAPVSGRLVQWLGEQPVYLVGLLIVAVSTGLCAVAQTYWQLIVVRAAGGIGSTMFTVSALGLLIRISPASARGRAAGLYGTSFLVGSVGGPLLGSALAFLGLRAPFVIYAVALLVAAGVVYFALRGSHLAAPEVASGSRMALSDAVRSAPYRSAVLASFINGWALFGVRMAVVPLFVVEVMHQDSTMSGVALTVFAVGNVLVLLLAGRGADFIGRRPMLVSGLFVSGVATIGMGLSPGIVPFLAMSFVAGLGSGLMNPAMQAVVADVLGAKSRGGPVLATFQMVSDLGAVIGPVVAGVVAQEWSFGMAFVVTGVVLLIGSLVWVRTPETLRR